MSGYVAFMVLCPGVPINDQNAPYLYKWIEKSRKFRHDRKIGQFAKIQGGVRTKSDIGVHSV